MAAVSVVTSEMRREAIRLLGDDFEPFAAVLKNLSWGRKERKTFARPPRWKERKKHRRADEEEHDAAFKDLRVRIEHMIKKGKNKRSDKMPR